MKMTLKKRRVWRGGGGGGGVMGIRGKGKEGLSEERRYEQESLYNDEKYWGIVVVEEMRERERVRVTRMV